MTRMPPAPTDQYTALPDARLVTTRALLTARENLTDTINARAMMCLHGGAGFGKTVATTSCLRELEASEDIRRITFHARATTRAVRHELHATLRKEPMLSSRIFIWQRFTRLTSDEVLETIPLYHPIWADADPADITFADNSAAHGNFRNWARLTAHTRTALQRTGRSRVDPEVLRWAFSRLGSGTA
ncbi:ATP-binding protein [Streptomyces sp. NPDC054871]